MKHRAKHRKENLAREPELVSPYMSVDIEFGGLPVSTYEPPYPLTQAERELAELNQARREDLAAAEAWLKFQTQALVNEELTRAGLAAQLDQDIIHGESKDH